MKIIGIIPARYASTRFPGKPLCVIDGKTMIRRVYDRAASCSGLTDLIVATDDQRIEKHVREFGGRVIMTSERIRSGTERCYHAVNELYQNNHEIYDAVINIQGDEPYIQTAQIDKVAGSFLNQDVNIATLVKKIASGDDLNNHNVVKVIIDKQNKAIYFSRFAIPYLRGGEYQGQMGLHTYYKHIGIYGYRSEILREITSLPESSLEKAESLEQLRWIENGYSIHVLETEFESIAIDTPDDLLKITNKPG